MKWFTASGLAPKPGQKADIFDDMAILIHLTIKYARREAMGVQSSSETLKLASGSCRDMAILMMETSRALGYPARFVSGYMESENTNVGGGSTHTWAEFYLPAHGWTGYDPSIGKRVGAGHISVGVSHNPHGVMPVSGGFMGLSGIGTSLKVGISTRSPAKPRDAHFSAPASDSQRHEPRWLRICIPR